MTTTVYVGGYGPDSVACYATDGSNAAWRLVGRGVGVDATFLALAPDGRHLYASHSGAQHLSTYAIGADGAPALLGTAPTHTVNPAHLAVAPDGRTVIAASFTSGHVTAHRIAPDGTLTAPVSHLATGGELGPRPAQSGSQPHQISFAPDLRTVTVPDRGTDRVHLFSYDPDADEVLSPLGSVAAPTGSGPRHLTWHPRLPLAYLIGELDSTMVTLRWQPDRRTLEVVAASSLRPADATGDSSAAAVMITPDGRQLFGTNRGDDSICRFLLDDSGIPREDSRSWLPAGGRTPRFAGLDPSGTRLWCASQDSDVITGYDISGPDPVPVGTLEHPRPSCLVFV